MMAAVPETKWKVVEDRETETVHVVPHPNSFGHAERGRQCFCRPRIETYPEMDVVVHNQQSRMEH
jgi:hypothetical protein